MDLLPPFAAWFNRRSGAQILILAVLGFFLLPRLVAGLPLLPDFLDHTLQNLVKWGWLFFLGYLWQRRPKADAGAARLVESGFTPGPHAVHLATRSGRVCLNNPFRGVLITGGAGAGKSFSLVEPLLYEGIAHGFAGLVYDFKFPALAEHVAQGFVESNRSGTPFYVTFQDVERSHRVNPLRPDLLPSISHAQQAAAALVLNLIPSKNPQGDFWSQSARLLVAAAIWFLRERHPDQCTLPHAVNLLFHSPQEFIPALSAHPQTRDLVAGLRQAVENDAKAQISGVLGTVQGALADINTPEVCWVLSGDDFTLDVNDPADPKWVVLGNYPALANVYSPVLALLVATAAARMNTQHKAPSLLVLDEAPTLFLPNFDQIPATARSNKLATVFCVQDLAQVTAKYGADTAKSILANLNTAFFGKTTNPETGKYVADLYGQHDVTFTTKSESRQANRYFEPLDKLRTRSTSQSVQQRARVSPRDVAELATGTFFVQAVESNVDATGPGQRLTCTPLARPVPPPLPPVHAVTPDELRANFARIKQEVATVLAQYAPGASAAPSAPAPPAEPEPAPESPDKWGSFVN